MVYVEDNIPSKLLVIVFSNRKDCFVEINVRKNKWFFFCLAYHPQNCVITTHIVSIEKVIDLPSTRYRNFILIDDFNVT